MGREGHGHAARRPDRKSALDRYETPVVMKSAPIMPGLKSTSSPLPSGVRGWNRKARGTNATQYVGADRPQRACR